jgi:SMI1 / KNR4 family (SUKH-1)
MSPAEIAEIESALGVTLPQRYRTALQNHGLSADWTEHPEFITDKATLAQENRHFRMNPEDLSEVRAPGVLGSIKFYLLYGSGKRLLDSRRKWFATWAKGGRFVIGNDLGEEQYYIKLSEASPTVHCYQLENKRSRKVAESLDAWLVEVKRRQVEAEAESET